MTRSLQIAVEDKELDNVASIRQSIQLIKTKRAENKMNVDQGLAVNHSWTSAAKISVLNQFSS